MQLGLFVATQHQRITKATANQFIFQDNTLTSPVYPFQQSLCFLLHAIKTCSAHCSSQSQLYLKTKTTSESECGAKE